MPGLSGEACVAGALATRSCPCRSRLAVAVAGVAAVAEVALAALVELAAGVLLAVLVEPAEAAVAAESGWLESGRWHCERSGPCCPGAGACGCA